MLLTPLMTITAKSGMFTKFAFRFTAECCSTTLTVAALFELALPAVVAICTVTSSVLGQAPESVPKSMALVTTVVPAFGRATFTVSVPSAIARVAYWGILAAINFFQFWFGCKFSGLRQLGFGAGDAVRQHDGHAIAGGGQLGEPQLVRGGDGRADTAGDRRPALLQ